MDRENQFEQIKRVGVIHAKLLLLFLYSNPLSKATKNSCWLL